MFYTQLTEPSHEDSVSANNMHKSVVVPNKTAQYCDVTKSHQESETQSLSSANPTELTQNKDHMLKDGFQYSKRYRDKLAKRNTRKSIQSTATDGGSDFVAAEHISVHKVCITNVNNSVDLNKMML